MDFDDPSTFDIEGADNVDDPLPADEISDETQDFVLLKKIDIYTPVLKLAIDKLTENKEQFCHVTKSDYDKLSHLYHVFTQGDSKEKLDIYSSCEQLLEKLHDRYRAISKRKRHISGESSSTNATNTSDLGETSVQNSGAAQPSFGTSTVPSAAALVPVLHNIVSSVDLGCKLDLTKIALATRNAEFNPKRFHAVVLRMREPSAVTLIFGTGKLVTTGTKSEASAHLAARKCARIIQKLGNNVKFMNFKIQNMVATCDIRFPIHVESLYKTHVQFCNYEPELFPGLIYRVVRPRLVILIFVTGKFIITGAKDRSQLQKACEFIYPILRQFKKQ